MTFSVSDVKTVAAGIKRCLPTDRPLSAEISVRLYDLETKEYLNMVLEGTPPGLTLEASINGKYLKYYGAS